MNSEVATVVVLGLGCAANPWGIMIAVLLLDARRGHAIVWTYVAAWVASITVVLAVVLSSVGAVVDAGSDGASTAAALVELLIGATLVSWGAVRIRRARDEAETASAGAAPELPGWLRAIENLSYPAAFLLGIYSATYPFVIAAAGEILRAGGSPGETAAVALVFIVLGSSTVVLVAALGTFAPDRSGAHLARMRTWLTIHSGAVVTAILLLFGAALTARGVSGLA